MELPLNNSKLQQGIFQVKDGAIEAVRALQLARNSAVKAASAAINALRALITTSPEETPQPAAWTATRPADRNLRRVRP
ncbi:hypothetical protein ACFWPX_02975 [Nocardia sp. NPDC058518]|uniref:hypothetical protein n=1 Tax=Nocardia sp. NPDC058518 TaxID=3346534 RepID=UPI00364DDAF2